MLACTRAIYASLGTSSLLGQDVNGAGATLATRLAKIGPRCSTTRTSPHIQADQQRFRNAVVKRPLDVIKEAIVYLHFCFSARDDGLRQGHSDCLQKISSRAMLVDMTETETMTLGLALADPMYTSAGDLEVDGSFTKDLRFFSGQKSAMHAHRAAGVGVYIIGASPELYTVAAGSCFGLGDMVPKENRCGVRFTTDEADASLLSDRTCEFFGTTESGTNNTYLLQGGPSHQYVDHVTCLLAEGFIKNEIRKRGKGLKSIIYIAEVAIMLVHERTAR
ncbi:hypothetical protein PHYSODRAFT_336793 [Phytophthora sojae]|uniref:Uncharacterized protein n=1 Tax=Phytophthora sojae (strain P6497) TaxID=1094619 RepID=G4ZWE1_PHYSP|nr:hypothetical protein PHYSODRAFT_336793 [Phytophthora sojae]EGZ12369.1 hypothetical protein PHYSODRAFT_336793 [Phytophthora sojae]|eukprot:XP_009532702.1 hypothetical protein PHYSODRAFT_336793 [Phytophthora sojae]